ncbi:acyltransferase family protein [Frigidibacter albus]|uniref:Acyltransferase family protein n=1 Tax=Frigidibacter albus TaxID=1465486 RepID=A0A6L8VCI6_9RHOB|nr:acyltransferase family protein [Frigidibacter albus]MZQ88035.1 acyltransferase family protein [Frigidibacter albus]NBE30291.1 acyltransferase family protein [Frigidibacter albus]GGH47900.1 acyltransferase [Frigidibacter albus]
MSGLYRREIDGLRAIAVLPVILFHAGFDAFGGGYVGVDVFFVISGYLIAGILARELAAGEFSLMRFYERRARRILPALFVMLAATVPLAWVLMTPSQLTGFFSSLGSVAIFAANLHFYQAAGYFAAETEMQPLIHTWSLAVEEQFYLIFPPLVAALWRWWPRMLWPVLALLAAASLAVAIRALPGNPEKAFFLPEARAWELLAGALLALWPGDRLATARGGSLLAGLGLALILGPVLVYDEHTPFPGLAALPPVIGTLLVLHAARAGTAVAALLSWRPLVGLGLVSYSAYLWHQPLFSGARLAYLTEPPPALMIGLTGLTLILAVLSWRYVEQPVRRGAVLLRRRAVFGAAGTGIAVVLLIGLLGQSHSSALWRWTHPGLAPDLARLEAAQDRPAPFDDGACFFMTDTVDPGLLARMMECHARFGPGLVMLGDSHAMDLIAAIATRADRPAFMVGLTEGGCRLYRPQTDCEFDAFLDVIRDHPGLVKRVLYEQAGFYLFSPDGEGNGSRSILNDLALDKAVPDLQPIPGASDAVLAYLDAVSEHAEVYWLGPRLAPHVPLELVLRHGCRAPVGLRPNLEAEYRALDTYLEGRTEGEGLRYVSMIDMLDLAFPVDLQDCGAFFWADGDHFSKAGAARFGDRLDPGLWH